jgi:predicted nucleic acid-binding Zn ribbon protein
MPKTRRKHPHCLNCGYLFNTDENFCPDCGQENNQKIKSFRYFIIDFWNDLVQIDNRLIRSIRPFLFIPGKLTNEYLAGKQVQYIAPIRLYFTFSFLYFLLVSYEIGKVNFGSNSKDEFRLMNVNIVQTRKQDSLKLLEYKAMLSKVNKQKGDSLKLAKKIQNILRLDSSWARADSTLRQYIPKNPQNLSGGLGLSGMEWIKVLNLTRNSKISEDAIADSMKTNNKFWKRLIVKQIVRLNRSDNAVILNYMTEKIPIAMFVILPFFALFLKLVYVRSGRYFVEHLIFTLHIHSFYFLMLTVLTLVLDILKSNENKAYTILGVFLILMFYTYKSFRNVYRQNRFKTLLKITFLLFLYTLALSFGLTIVLTISLLWF